MGLNGLRGIRGLSGIVPSSAVDPDALAFLTAAGISDPGQRSALDALVKGFKANGTWSKHTLIYPFLGGTADSHKWNLKDPRDLDTAYRVSWVGNMNHGTYGVQGDGVTAYGQTYYTGANYCLGVYSPNDTAAMDALIGSNFNDGVGYRSGIHPRWSDGLTYFDPVNYTSTRLTAALTGPLGWLQYSYQPNISLFASQNGGVVATRAAPGDLATLGQSLILGASSNSAGGAYSISSRIISFASSSNYLTPSEVAADYAVIQAYQTALGRAV